MKTTLTTANKNEIILAAIKDLAARYDLPELLTAPITLTEPKEGTTSHSVNVQAVPRGQIAAIVSKMTATVTVFFEAGGKLSARIGLSYSHHSGGSNGSNNDFIIVTRDNYHDGRTYEGMISVALLHSYHMEQQLNRP